MEKIFRTFRAEIKDVNKEEATLTCVVSTESVDRDKEIIKAEAFKKRLKIYKAHPVLLSSHRYDQLTRQIGEAKNVRVTENGLEATFKYYVNAGNPEADWGYFLASQKIAAFSIGFIAHAWEDKSGENGVWRVFTDVELIEVSQVLVPSNRDAVTERLSAEGIDSHEKELCEMAIKSLDWADSAKAEDKPAPAAESVPAAPEAEPAEAEKAAAGSDPAKTLSADQIKALQPGIIKALSEDQAFIEKLAGEVSRVMSSPDKKHYSNLLFGAAGGSPDADLKKEDLEKCLRDAINNAFKP